MTRDSDFKKLVRERMRTTGQNYTAAKASLVSLAPQPVNRSSAWAEAKREHDKVVRRFVVDGRLVRSPAKRKSRAAVLLYLTALFEPRKSYPEAEVNRILGEVDDDFAFWRRELVNYGYLEREAGIYRLPTTAPLRSAVLRQEIPAWEAVWLPGFLAGHD